MKRDTSKTSGEQFLSLFSFVPRRIEIPTEIQQVKKRRSHSDWWHFHWSDGKRKKKQGLKQKSGIIRDSACSALCDVYLS